jgi:hypothetical protein
MRHEQQRTLAPVSFQPRHDAGAARDGLEDFSLDAGALQNTLQVMSDLRFVAGRILRVDSNQFCQEPGCFSLRLIGVQTVLSCWGLSECSTHKEEANEEGQKRA